MNRNLAKPEMCVRIRQIHHIKKGKCDIILGLHRGLG